MTRLVLKSSTSISLFVSLKNLSIIYLLLFIIYDLEIDNLEIPLS